MANHKGVMVYAEVTDNKLAPISSELLGCGHKLASNLGEELIAVLIGSGIKTIAPDIIAFGADKVYTVDNSILKDYQGDTYLQVMERVVKQVSPQIFLMGHTSIGRDLAPRLAFRLKTTANLDCVDLTLDPQSKRLLQTKPVYGGNAHAIFTSEFYPQIVTIRAKTMPPLARDDSRKGEVIGIEASIDPAAIRVKLLEKKTQETEGIKLEDAEVVISGGRGIGGPEGFQQLQELAKLLKGAVGASRPACDNTWVPDVLMVGLTGKIIAPQLYFAVGISGSSQHLAGCSSSKNIIAINTDPEANIFKYARYGIIGDWKKVLPAITNKVKELASS